MYLATLESDISVSEEMENVVAFIQNSRRLYPSDATKHTPVIDHKGIITCFIDELIEIASGKDIQDVSTVPALKIRHSNFSSGKNNWYFITLIQTNTMLSNFRHITLNFVTKGFFCFHNS